MTRPARRKLKLLRHTLLVALLLASAVLQAQVTAGPSLIDEVETAHWSTATLPPSTLQWHAIQLPYNTRENLARTDTRLQDAPFTWFRLILNAPSSDSNFGLYLWRFNLAANVYFNGKLIAASPSAEKRETMSWNHPMLVPIQAANWRAGENEILLRLTRSPWGGNLAPPVFGDFNVLSQLYEARMLRQVELNEILFALALALSLISFMLWTARPRDSVYLWFSAMCLSWSVICAHMIILRNPIPYAIWLPLVHLAIDFSIYFMYGFIGRLIKSVKIRRRERLFLLWTSIASITHFLVPEKWFFSIAYSAHLIGFICLAILVARVARLAWQERNTPAAIVSLSLFVQIALFVQNYYLQFFSTTAQWEGNMFYAHFGIPVLFIVFIATLLWRFQNVLNLAEDMNKELEHKVEASRKVIEKHFSDQRALELQKTAEQERLNIYRELHDDVGSKLLSIVHAGHDSKLADMARAALESLRHAVSKANNPDQELSAFLQDIREETELRLVGSSHHVSWSQNIPERECIVPSKLAFTINRILKEVVSNIIRHAQADRVTVEIHCDQSIVHFAIGDNGKGFDRHGPMGNGINNILSRAREIEANVNWDTRFKHGTRFTVSFPASALLSVQLTALQQTHLD